MGKAALLFILPSGERLELLELQDGETADVVCACRRGWRSADGFRLLSISSCPACAELVLEALPCEDELDDDIEIESRGDAHGYRPLPWPLIDDGTP